MSLAGDIGLAAGALGVIGGGGIFTWARWLHSHGSSISARWFAKHAAPIIAAELRPVFEQLAPNHGTSAVDKLERLDQWRDDFSGEVAREFRDIKNHLNRQDRTMTRHLEAHAK